MLTPGQQLDAAARRMHTLMQSTVAEDEKVPWAELAEDEQLAVRQLFAAGLAGWREAGGQP